MYSAHVCAGKRSESQGSTCVCLFIFPCFHSSQPITHLSPKCTNPASYLIVGDPNLGPDVLWQAIYSLSHPPTSYVFLFACVRVYTHTLVPWCVCVELRGQHIGVASLLPLGGFQGSNSDHITWGF